MKVKAWWNERNLRNIIIATLFVQVLDGAVTTFFTIRPFWIDEWRVIYNLKAKSLAGLWGTLDYMQQFPRLYLTLIKIFTAAFTYSYQALRLPSLIVGIMAILVAWQLMRRIYPAREPLQYLLPMVLISSVPFTKYFVQVKQYSMDIALSLVAIWQLLELVQLVKGASLHPARFTMLCVTMLLAPMFSYTYPISIAPAFVLTAVGTVRNDLPRWRPALPLILSVAGIAGFYMLDVAQLMRDAGMKAYWQYNLAPNLPTSGILDNFYSIFAQVGSGAVYNIIFGVLGIVSFLFACYRAVNNVRFGEEGTSAMLRQYCVLLLLLVLVLFLTGKLPLGESRLNAFLTAPITLLNIDLLLHLRRRSSRRWLLPSIGFILYAGVVGNIYSTIFNSRTEADLAKKRGIYATIGRAVRTAKAQHVPILATPGVAYPYEEDMNLPYQTKLPGDWILKTHPAYHFADSIPVYPIAAVEEAEAFFDTSLGNYKAAIACDGISLKIIRRK